MRDNAIAALHETIERQDASIEILTQQISLLKKSFKNELYNLEQMKQNTLKKLAKITSELKNEKEQN